MTEHVSCDCKCKLNSTVYNWNQIYNNKICQCECKTYRTCKKNCSWNPTIYICENSEYLKSISVTVHHKVSSVMDVVSTKKTNVSSTASINCHNIKVRDCYILHTVFLAII